MQQQVGWDGIDTSDSGQYCTILLPYVLTVHREDPKILPGPLNLECVNKDMLTWVILPQAKVMGSW